MLQATLLEEFLVKVDPNGSQELAASAREDVCRVSKKLFETREREPLPSYDKVPPPDYSSSSYVISQRQPDGTTFDETMGLSLQTASEDNAVHLRPLTQEPSSNNESRRSSRLSIIGLGREVSRRLRTSSSANSSNLPASVHPMQPRPLPTINPQANLVQALQTSNNNPSATAISNSTPSPTSNHGNSTESLTSASSTSTRVSRSCACTLSRYRKIQQVRNSTFDAGKGISDSESWVRCLLDREEHEDQHSESSHGGTSSVQASPSMENAQLLLQTPSTPSVEDEEAARLRHREQARRTLCSEESTHSTYSSQEIRSSNQPSNIITLIPFPSSSNINRNSNANCQINSFPASFIPDSSTSISSSQFASSNSNPRQQRNSRSNSRRFCSGFFGLSLGLGTGSEARQQSA